VKICVKSVANIPSSPDDRADARGHRPGRMSCGGIVRGGVTTGVRRRGVIKLGAPIAIAQAPAHPGTGFVSQIEPIAGRGGDRRPVSGRCTASALRSAEARVALLAAHSGLEVALMPRARQGRAPVTAQRQAPGQTMVRLLLSLDADPEPAERRRCTSRGGGAVPLSSRERRSSQPRRRAKTPRRGQAEIRAIGPKGRTATRRGALSPSHGRSRAKNEASPAPRWNVGGVCTMDCRPSSVGWRTKAPPKGDATDFECPTSSRRTHRSATDRLPRR